MLEVGAIVPGVVEMEEGKENTDCDDTVSRRNEQTRKAGVWFFGVA